jgi:acetyltransferase-like isoleucine patch superfamily enzyme
MAERIHVPRLNANEDELLLASLEVSVGQRVEAGQLLLVLESSKSTFEVVAERAGVVRWLDAEPGEMVEVGKLVCVLSDTEDEPLPEEVGAGHAAPADEAAPKRKLTAKERLRQRRAAAQAGAALKPAQPVEDTRAVLPPSAEVAWVCAMRRTLEEGVVALAEERVFEGPLTGPHSEDGLHLDAGARLDEDARLVTRRAFLARNARVGRGTTLRAGALYLGAQVDVGAGVSLHSGEILIEDGTRVVSGASGDVSGGLNPDSRLIVGGASLIGTGAYLNTCHEVFIERGCAVSPRAMIFTHSFWQSVLDGYRPLFAPVRMCEDSWAGAACHVLPGVVIGAGSTLLSSSTLVQDLPPECLFGGIPARLIRRGIRRSLSTEAQVRILRKLLEEFAEHARFKGCEVEQDADQDLLRVRRADVGTRTVVLATAARRPAAVRGEPLAFLSLGAEVDAGPNDAVLDLSKRRASGAEDRVVHELRNFLRRQGIRFRPYAWDADHKRGL